MASDAPSDPDDLDALVRRVDPDRWLSSRFIADPGQRADVIALYAFDHELARAPRIASNPLLGEIRLTWWREVLEEIFEDRAVRRHPTAQALAGAVARRGLAREPLETMIDARYRELDPEPLSAAEAVAWARDTAGRAAQAAVAALDPAASGDQALAAAGAWALARRVAEQPDLRGAFERLLAEGRREAARLSPAAFPAVAHGVFAAARARGRTTEDLGSRLRITLAVARGRI
ncbi:squalene/phytoene synthase family protein [Phenylobacterium sp. LjRoot225]|uniref:squalene/phytoene synthase family protein n=1 Tax=Phenylobacterium sp. LjRoot225 TaxID=3342285 RepID=UPI003ECD84B0